ncbi:uncharacterized protein VP01_7803g1, partial [Puccinia sorghi]
IYEADLSKRTRTSKEQEEQQGMKRNKRKPESVMDLDEEIFKIANTPLCTLKPSSQSFQLANKVRFQNPSSKEEIPSTPKEKPARKTYLDTPLSKETPQFPLDKEGESRSELGYIKLTVNEEFHQALLDTGSMVNTIPVLAQQLGLVIIEKPMKIKGVGGHHTEILGIAEK